MPWLQASMWSSIFSFSKMLTDRGTGRTWAEYISKNCLGLLTFIAVYTGKQTLREKENDDA